MYAPLQKSACTVALSGLFRIIPDSIYSSAEINEATHTEVEISTEDTTAQTVASTSHVLHFEPTEIDIKKDVIPSLHA